MTFSKKGHGDGTLVQATGLTETHLVCGRCGLADSRMDQEIAPVGPQQHLLTRSWMTDGVIALSHSCVSLVCKT